jgi:hypothetical protein
MWQENGCFINAFVKYNCSSNPTDEASSACIALKTTKNKHDIKCLSSLVQQKKKDLAAKYVYSFSWILYVL